MVATESVGRAMKNSLSGIARPAVGPFSQVVPVLLVRAAGTNTWYRPAESRNRYGFSRLRRFASSVVYGGLGKDWTGAPVVPAKTWFHTAFDQPPTLLSRTRNCCWDPLITNPVLE